MKREDFLRLENQQTVWKQLQQNTKHKMFQIDKNVTLKNEVMTSFNFP